MYIPLPGDLSLASLAKLVRNSPHSEAADSLGRESSSRSSIGSP